MFMKKVCWTAVGIFVLNKFYNSDKVKLWFSGLLRHYNKRFIRTYYRRLHFCTNLVTTYLIAWRHNSEDRYVIFVPHIAIYIALEMLHYLDFGCTLICGSQPKLVNHPVDVFRSPVYLPAFRGLWGGMGSRNVVVLGLDNALNSGNLWNFRMVRGS
jgi:hypothetical protein